MKNIAPWVFVLAGLLALMGGASASDESRTTIRITTGDWPPYTSESAPFYGVASHIVMEAFAEVDIVVDFGFFPWTRAMKLARDGEWDGTSIWFETEERREHFHYSEPIIVATNVFFFLKGSGFEWSSFEDLAGLRVGGTREYSYGIEFDAAEASGVFRTQRSKNDEAGIENLLKGRIDVFPGELRVTYQQIHESFSDEEAALITHHPKPASIQALHLLLSKNVKGNEHMLELFNEGLRRLRQSGRYDQIVSSALEGDRLVVE